MARPRKSSDPEYTRRRGRVLWARFQYSDDLRKTACDLYGVSHWPALREWSLETSDPLKAQHLLISEHADSILATQDIRKLEIDDFWCRYLVVDDVWIPLGESLLIAAFSPIWNQSLDGFGNHDPGAGRYGGMRPRWDVVHPGREWAAKCKARPEADMTIISEIETYLRGAALPPSKIRLLGSEEGPILDAEIVPDDDSEIPEDGQERS